MIGHWTTEEGSGVPWGMFMMVHQDGTGWVNYRSGIGEGQTFDFVWRPISGNSIEVAAAPGAEWKLLTFDVAGPGTNDWYSLSFEVDWYELQEFGYGDMHYGGRAWVRQVPKRKWYELLFRRKK